MHGDCLWLGFRSDLALLHSIESCHWCRYVIDKILLRKGGGVGGRDRVLQMPLLL